MCVFFSVSIGTGVMHELLNFLISLCCNFESLGPVLTDTPNPLARRLYL